MNRFLSIAVVVLLALPALADENPPQHPNRGGALHYLITTDHVLAPGELEADGVEVQHALPGNRYLVRAADAAALGGASGVRSVELYAARAKMSREGWRSAASSSPFVTINVLFHDDTTFDAALAAVEAAGGTIETPLAVAVTSPQRLEVRIPPASIAALARDEAVFGVYGRPLRPAPLNDLAAKLSNVAPVYGAPYNLDGSGIVLSQFEPDDGSGSLVDTTHPELTGRVTTHGSTKVGRHATHVAGTMIAKGLTAAAKGMAPNATLQEYDLNGSTAEIFATKASLGTLNVTGDNNSWGFVLGWQPSGGSITWTWSGGFDYFGNYDALYSAPYDKIAIDPAVNVLYVHSSGNDGTNGNPDLDTNGRHRHVADSDGSVLTSEIFCYSQNGSGTDCPVPTCSAGNSTKSTEDDGSVASHCEIIKHPTYTAYGTLSFIAAEKNVLAVGACGSAGELALFSSRGPAKDGRVKPDLMAMGLDQFSTVPNGAYANMSGTSMSSPVVTGIAALVAQQWKLTFNNARPTPQQIKTLLIAGARDQVGDPSIDLPGPDYTYGFGLVDAQASVDLIRADAGTGSHVRTASVANGQTIEIPLTVTAAGKLRAVLGWADPEVVLPPPTDTEDPIADKTLVNDLDLKIVDASGNTTLPYVLDKNHPTVAATRGVNSVDNTEVVEIANAAPGNYRAVIAGKSVPVKSPQTYVFVSTLATAGTPVVQCTDSFEPNETALTAKTISSGQVVSARACDNDTDWFTFIVGRSGPVTVTVTTKDTPVTVQLNSPGPTQVNLVPIPANTTMSVTGTVSTTAAQGWFVKVTPTGTVSGDSSYTFTATFPLPILGRFPGRRGH
jgi:Subtilase family